MKKTSFLVFLLCAAALPAKVTLSQAVADAWKISPALRGQQLEEQAAATARLTALRQKYFFLAFSGSYRYTSDKVEVTVADFPFPLAPGMAPGTTVLSAPSASVDMKLALQQPIYNGGVLDNGVKAEALRAAAEQHLTRLKKIELAGKVKNAFFSHRLFCKKRAALNSLLAKLTLHQGRLENLHREGLVRRSDLLEAMAKADEVRLNLEDLEQLIRSEALHFSTLCGHDPQDIEPPAASAGESYAAAREFFLASHPLLRALDQRLRLARLQKKTIAGSYLPQVNAFAELHYGRPGQNFFASRWTPYFAGGVSVSMPVFNWNRNGRDQSLADIAASKLELQRTDFVRESEKNLRQLFFHRESLGKKLSLLEGLAANAAENAGLKERLYEENQVDHSDYLAALTDAERYASMREEFLAQVELLEVGILTVIGKCEEE